MQTVLKAGTKEKRKTVKQIKCTLLGPGDKPENASESWPILAVLHIAVGGVPVRNHDDLGSLVVVRCRFWHLFFRASLCQTGNACNLGHHAFSDTENQTHFSKTKGPIRLNRITKHAV